MARKAGRSRLTGAVAAPVAAGPFQFGQDIQDGGQAGSGIGELCRIKPAQQIGLCQHIAQVASAGGQDPPRKVGGFGTDG
jgi:hypothetical protein